MTLLVKSAELLQKFLLKVNQSRGFFRQKKAQHKAAPEPASTMQPF